MKQKLCDVNQAAEEKLPPKMEDKSGIGVHYMDAYIKPMNAKLPDGTAVKAKRRGLKITLQVGAKKGEGHVAEEESRQAVDDPFAHADRRSLAT